MSQTKKCLREVRKAICNSLPGKVVSDFVEVLTDQKDDVLMVAPYGSALYGSSDPSRPVHDYDFAVVTNTLDDRTRQRQIGQLDATIFTAGALLDWRKPRTAAWELVGALHHGRAIYFDASLSLAPVLSNIRPHLHVDRLLDRRLARPRAKNRPADIKMRARYELYTLRTSINYPMSPVLSDAECEAYLPVMRGEKELVRDRYRPDGR